MKIVYAPRALRDLEGIEKYLFDRSETGRRNVLAAIKHSIGQLKKFPRIGVPINQAGLFRLPVRRYPYLVFYRVTGSTVFILHVRHGAREPVGAEDL